MSVRPQDAVKELERALSNNALQGVEELRQYYALRKADHRRIVANVLSAKNRPLETFRLSTRPSPAELRELFDWIRNLYLDIGVLSVPGKDRNGNPVQVPITLDYSSKSEDHNYHCVEFARSGDGAIFELLVRQADNYVVATRMYLKKCQRDTTPWCVCGDCKIPASFGTQRPMKYTSTHDRLDNIKISVFTLDQIFDLLESLQNDPEQDETDEGKRLLVTLFLLLGEAPRFAQLQQFFITYSGSEIVRELDPDIIDLFRSIVAGNGER
ncbi:uncharacterized protein [Triticum aestivum]|uniref:uncharacterized protein n=1 Tax=Triticum aestivum TaxID=4565 RepID=UPI001D003672|nr:uncharacterized protein LOC123039500 [Triticum aestivum]XP_044318578.1 uncharacterized protein LOC123039501 [Triticum aestivum]